MHIRKNEWGLGLYEGERPRFAGFGLGLAPDPEEGLIASSSREKVEELADYGDSLLRDGDLPVERWWRFKAASGAPGKPAPGEFSRYHVIRFLDGPGVSGQNLLTPTGRLKTFKSREDAQKAADRENASGPITAERMYLKYGTPQVKRAVLEGRL
jgi:hypothetical protein